MDECKPLYTGLLPPGETSLDRAVMRRLGHLSFDANSASGHQAGAYTRPLFSLTYAFSVEQGVHAGVV